MRSHRNSDVLTSWINVGVFLLLALCPIRVEADASESTSEAFQRLAGKFQFFGVREFLYGRSEIYLADPVAMRSYLQTLDEFTARKDSVADLLPLLKHSNPRVRLLAMMALYDKGADHSLADIQNLASDGEAVYQDPPVDMNRVLASGIGPPHEPKTVGEAADALLKLYYEAAGYDGTFDDYWKRRKDRACCAGWYVVRLMRATQCTNPLPYNSVARIHALRKEVDRLPLSDRRWIILQLALREHNEYGTSNLASETELTQVSREIGSETLRKMIRSLSRPSDAPRDAALPSDPDLSIYNLSWFIYAHDKKLLEERDADDVYAAGNIVVASELRPVMASTWLRSELTKQSAPYQGFDRARTLAAMWRIVGNSEAEFILDHFFNDPVETRAYPTERRAFLEESATAKRPDFRTLVAKIVADPRFSRTGPDTLRAVATIINGWTAKPVLTEDELVRTYGHDELDADGEKLQMLHEFQKRIQDSVPQWSKQ